MSALVPHLPNAAIGALVRNTIHTAHYGAQSVPMNGGTLQPMGGSAAFPSGGDFPSGGSVHYKFMPASTR